MSDLISRQAAIDALHMHLMYRMGTDSNKKRLDDWINGVPSAQPEAVEAIPVEWIEKHIKELQESFASFAGWPVIENMLMKWKEEQK